MACASVASVKQETFQWNCPSVEGYRCEMANGRLTISVNSRSAKPIPNSATALPTPAVLSRSTKEIKKTILQDANIRGPNPDTLFSGRDVEPRGSAP